MHTFYNLQVNNGTITISVFIIYYIKTLQREDKVTHFSKDPLLVQTVDEEDGRLCEGHEEVAHGQVHDEVVWKITKLFVTAQREKEETTSSLSVYYCHYL